jgi:hypothetical protein
MIRLRPLHRDFSLCIKQEQIQFVYGDIAKFRAGLRKNDSRD